VSLALLNNATQVGGESDTAVSDPNGEDYCAFGTSLICLGFVWQNGVLSPLPALGGNNSQVAALNTQGQVVGYAETGYHDPDCVAPQVLQTLPVVWNGGHPQTLATFPGDGDGAAFGINDNGDVTGSSGACGAYDGRYGVALVPKHALLWRGGRLIYLGTLGGQINNSGFAINNVGQVVGASDIAGDQYQHAFFWQSGTMTDMGTLPGDVVSAAVGVNNRGQATGVSIDGGGNIRGFLWQSGVMRDLNDLIPANSPLYLLHGFGINNAGEIVGLAYVFSTGEVHGFLAVPVHAAKPGAAGGAQSRSTPKPQLPENVRSLLHSAMHGRVYLP
jgi:probable HAF family extracellular repeat protein